MENGCVISLISDAGSPSISDPGSILVNECIKKNINIFSLPGPSSVTTAVSASGFSEKFFFYGFLPEKKNLFDKDLKILSNLESSIVFFISSKKIKKLIQSLKDNFAGRKIVICREMTKYYEEYLRFEVDEIKESKFDLKGELTIVISEKVNKKTSQTLGESDKRIINQMINKLSVKEIVNLIHQNKKISKKLIYNYCIEIKNEN